MSETENEVYAFCKQCKENVRLNISQQEIKEAESGLVAVLSVHGSPQHALLAYIDKELRVRGIEYPTAIQIKDTPQVSAVDESEADVWDEMEGDFSLHILVDFFGKQKKKAIVNFSHLIVHIMIEKPVYLIHDDKAMGRLVKSNLVNLLTEQSQLAELVSVIDHDSLASIKKQDAFIFDLQMTRPVKESVEVDSKHFEKIVKDALSRENSFFQLKYELSKLFFSYRRLVDILKSSEQKMKDRELAHEVAIDFSLLSTLLDIAEIEGIDTKSRVERDGLGSAIRSI
ncbi:MAG: hypothetical protein GF309_01130 [Candidatus Lokiarchaeota archaeon]|nr:hypothetical protein [Candidatus Lokiarchaeota archaeon]